MLCSIFSFEIVFAVRNKLNTLRVSQDSWVKYKFNFNWRCPRSRRRPFFNSIMTLRYGCRYQDHATQKKHVIKSFLIESLCYFCFAFALRRYCWIFLCEQSLIRKIRRCNIISVFDELVCLFDCSSVHLKKVSSFLSSCRFTELIFFPSDKCFVYNLFKENF